MGRRSCPASWIDPALRARLVLGITLVLALPSPFMGVLAAAGAAFAQPISGRAGNNPSGRTAKLFVEAAELRYDSDRNTVSAEGNARVYYMGRVLEADRVVYDRNSGRVYAEGHAKLTESDGTVLHGERFDLTDDFRDGFIESLRADTPPKPYMNLPPGPFPGGQPGLAGAVSGTYKTYFSAPRAERIAGDTTVFEMGTYTACEPCKDNPDKPPLWRVRAKRIIHKNDE
ncbi:MAG: hypothetical protein L0Y60_15730, partial [Beijerinckiaceae bacterium]|nr:hypothetical protein [Beijerinckiaceae bacterium]